MEVLIDRLIQTVHQTSSLLIIEIISEVTMTIITMSCVCVCQRLYYRISNANFFIEIVDHFYLVLSQIL